MSPQTSITPREFVDKWSHASNLKERSAAQEHFIDPCRMLGHPMPAELDPEGECFCFEAGAQRHGGGQGDALGAECKWTSPLCEIYVSVPKVVYDQVL